MNKLLIIAAIISATTATAAQAADIKVPMTKEEAAIAQKEHLTLQEQIRRDAQRDPYAESVNTTTQIQGVIVTEEIIEPAAADHMQPSRVFGIDKKGNTVIINQ